MSRADLIAARDAAAVAFERAEEAHHGEGTGETYRALEAARVSRRDAQDAVDQHDRANPEPGGDCPKCKGTSGRLEGIGIMAEWIDCKACEGTGEFLPEEKAS